MLHIPSKQFAPVLEWSQDKIEQAKETFEDTLNNVLPATKTVVEKLRGMASRPDEIEVTFGVKLNTVAGVVIASASAEANLV